MAFTGRISLVRLPQSLRQLVNSTSSTSNQLTSLGKGVVARRFGSGGSGDYGAYYKALPPKSDMKLYTRCTQILMATVLVPFTYQFYHHPYDYLLWMDNHKTLDPDAFTDAELGVPPDDWEGETDPVNFGLIKDHPYQKLRSE